jgi:sugar (pentulose or hexulose) kinase
LATGYLGTTLYWMDCRGQLPSAGTACFIPDLFASTLTGRLPVTDPTLAASSGLFDVHARQWDRPCMETLGLPDHLFPEVRESTQPLGPLTRTGAELTGLPVGLPVSVALGDNQAAFLGSVADRQDSVLLNVGTGAQVAAFTSKSVHAPPLETRPFPGSGNLLVQASLCGGRAYAVLERFFAQVGQWFFTVDPAQPLYAVMNQLAESIPPGSERLRCQPLFTGTRAQPEVRATWSGACPENFTPAHMVRALLEGMARQFHNDYRLIESAAGRSYPQVVGSGNALRDNPVLVRIVEDQFARPIRFPRHQEEAAVGAALIAAVGAKVCADLDQAGRLVG